ncbi:MAG: hypothetical protein KC442_14020 [Thermomicrobiales bacterium]|nr:hypothetical protein [Thermomicrobiales bacterium]
MSEPPPAPPPGSSGFLADALPVPDIGAAQRVVESLLLAAATSTGLYLVGSVYTDAYYSRMSVDATSLDLSPPYVALQAMHVLPSLLEYPLTLGLLIGLYRVLTRRLARVRSAYDWARSRLGRFFLFFLNLALVSPLLLAALRSVIDPLTLMSQSVVSEVNELMQIFGGLTFVYVLWLSFSARRDIVGEIRRHRWVPIGLLGMLYLLDALIASAHGAGLDAELLMTGNSSSSLAITFDDPSGALGNLPQRDLLLVIARNGIFYVVERQPIPPSPRPVSYMIPADEVTNARVQRVVPTNLELLMLEEDIFATPMNP